MKNNKKELFTDDHGVLCDEVRLLPYGGGGNIIVGRKSYDKEITFRKDRNKSGIPFDLPSWESLKVYGEK